tara:strand:- start:23 stop:910 length:888 start_codon:yes stop_codon:yes gene_type:complete
VNRIRNPEPAANPELRNLRAIRPLAALGALLLALAAGATELPHSTACTAPPLPEQNGGRLVIIIDDMGNNLRRGLSALELPGRLTYAVIPFTPFATTLADAAVAGGKEVMLHAPMSTVEDMPLERGALTSNLSREVFRQALRDALSSLPQARGLNNHMGSELTQQRRQMAWLMQELRTHDLYFVDSRTSDKTVAATVAAEFNVPHLSRQVFLDNERTLEAIDARFREVLALIDETGFAVAIGHPYPETIAYLRAALPLLAQTGIELAYVSDMVVRHQPASACPETPETTAGAVAG